MRERCEQNETSCCLNTFVRSIRVSLSWRKKRALLQFSCSAHIILFKLFFTKRVDMSACVYLMVVRLKLCKKKAKENERAPKSITFEVGTRKKLEKIIYINASIQTMSSSDSSECLCAFTVYYLLIIQLTYKQRGNWPKTFHIPNGRPFRYLCVEQQPCTSAGKRIAKFW